MKTDRCLMPRTALGNHIEDCVVAKDPVVGRVVKLRTFEPLQARLRKLTSSRNDFPDEVSSFPLWWKKSAEHPERCRNLQLVTSYFYNIFSSLINVLE